jgi:MoaF-like
MNADPIRGQAIRWTFSDGPMAKKTFEHTFERDGSVKWCSIEGDIKGKSSREANYQLASIGADVYAVSYLASSGYTLTVILDYRTGQLVAFASNETSLTLQHGTFEPEEGWVPRRKRERSEARAPRSH